MPILDCAECANKQNFPSTLTVVDEEIDGWKLDISIKGDEEVIQVNAAYCPDCQ